MAQPPLPGIARPPACIGLNTVAGFRIAVRQRAGPRHKWRSLSQQAYKVDIETPSGLETINVEEGNTILQTALDQGIQLTHDCKMGVCMTCPAKLVSNSYSLRTHGAATFRRWL